MIKRLIVIILIIPIIIGTTISKVESNSFENVVPQEALKASGATFNELKIIQWVKYKDEPEARELKNKWQKNLSKISPDFTGQIIIQPKTHYLIANIKSLHFDADFVNFNEMLPVNKVRQYQSIIYKGSFKGRISQSNQKKLIIKIKEVSRARQLDFYIDKNSCYWSGYTPLAKDAITIEDKKMNLNIAFRYNAIEDITYIFIGTPIITIEY